jgi:hypothetical protein
MPKHRIQEPAMLNPVAQTMHQSLLQAGVPGSWKLEAGRALSLTPAAAGVLRIAEGRVWVTLDMQPGDLEASGDLFLVPGRGLVVQAGQRVVLESAGSDRQAAAYFSWDPLPRAQAAAVGRAVPNGRWQHAVALPARQLGHALGQAGVALGRLTLGLLGLLLVPWRGRSPLTGRS